MNPNILDDAPNILDDGLDALDGDKLTVWELLVFACEIKGEFISFFERLP